MDFPLTSSLVARLEVVAQTASTNADLRAHAVDDAWPHLSTIVTRDQIAGRGRLDRVWTAPADTALAASTLIRRPVAPELRGWVPLIAGVAMADAIAAQLPHHEVGVKWPNDVLVDGRKICGILAEAVDEAIIVGAGVNTAMSVSQLPVSTATSFAVLGSEADDDRLLADYLRALDARIAALVAAAGAVESGAHAAATERSATLGLRVRASLPGGRTHEGTARRLDAVGRLVIDVDGVEQAVSAGDVVHLRPAEG